MTDVAKSFERIQDQALDSRAPLSDTLRLCVAVGGQVNARELIEWATAELSGYKGGRELPSYRLVSAQLLMDYMNGTAHVSHSTIPHGWLDDEIRELLADVPLSFPVRALEGMAAEYDGARLTPVDVETLMVLVNTQARRNRNEFFNITGLYWHVPQLVLAGYSTRSVLASSSSSPSSTSRSLGRALTP
ncbi:MAG: hypothetical protein HGA44_02190 [Cellulomonadaceae bacterium]|nr:hypothetical protein [Cellulomonadaceae bacterium]